MRMALSAMLGLGLALNGCFMLWAPAEWYAALPGVADTGPLNSHFVRDIGAAYLVSGGALLAFALDRRARPAALAGGVFLALHALVHLADAVAGRETLAHFAGDMPAVVAPALIALWLAWPRRPSVQEERRYA